MNEVSCSGEAWAGIRAGSTSLGFLVSRVVVLSPLILPPASRHMGKPGRNSQARSPHVNIQRVSARGSLLLTDVWFTLSPTPGRQTREDKEF